MFDIQQLRADFPILSRQVNGHPLIYLDNAATSQKPKPVIQAMVDYYEQHNANVHRGIHTLGDESTRLYQEARERVAHFIGAVHPDELIFTKNTTEGINLVAYSWAQKFLRADDEVLVSGLEHHSNLLPWQRVCQVTGARLVHIPLDDIGNLALSSLPSLVSVRTKMIAITHISNVLGTIIDIQHVANTLKKEGSKAKILLDCAQSIPHMPVSVRDYHVDFVVFSGHKMLGPMGIGGLWANRDVLNEMDPFLLGGGMISEVKAETASWAELPDKFDAGTPNVAGAIGLAAACAYLDTVGMQVIRDHEQSLVDYSLTRFIDLEEQGLIDLYGPRDPQKRSGIITFNVRGAHAHDVAQILDREFGIAVRSGHHCNQPLIEKMGVPATVRASFYLYNTTTEIDTLIEGIHHVYKMFNK